MKGRKQTYYPTILGAVHLVVLYLFIQTVVDFPLAVWDYYRGTDYLANPVKNILLQLGSIFFILYYGYRQANTRLKELFPLKRVNLLLLLPVTMFLAAAHIFLDEINREVEQLLPPPLWFLELFSRIFENDLGLTGTFLKVVIVAPVVEESIFRGILMHGFMRNYSKSTSIVVSALLFALFHLNPWQFPATFLLGMLLGWLMVIGRNLPVCIAGHAINNLLVLLSIQYWEPLQQSSFYRLDHATQLHISYAVSILSLTLIGLYAWKKRKI
ncbi:MAG: lysostaphin resistance A-like protein [Mangrovibacterium sp.]